VLHVEVKGVKPLHMFDTGIRSTLLEGYFVREFVCFCFPLHNKSYNFSVQLNGLSFKLGTWWDVSCTSNLN